MRNGTVSSARACSIAALVALALATSTRASPDVHRAGQARVPFLENGGEFAPAVKFHARTFGGTVFVLEDGSVRYALPQAAGSGAGWALDERLAGLDTASIEGLDPANTRVSVIRGNDPSQWRSRIPAYNGVALGEIDAGIGVELRAYGNNVEKLFTVLPGADARRIAVAVDGANGLCVDAESGQLVVDTGAGEVRFTRPVAYQDIAGRRSDVEVAYRVEGLAYGFDLGAHDPSHAVVIDPLLASTFLGGDNDEYGVAIEIDDATNVYVTGNTYSPDFPQTAGPIIGTGTNGNSEVYVSMLGPDLTNLLASVLVGGDDYETATALALDGAGRVYVVGMTESTNFPTTGGSYQPVAPNGAFYNDGFIVCIDTGLTTLIAGTYFGGTNADTVTALALGTNGVYVVGQTESGDHPVSTASGYDTTHDNPGFENDGFVACLDNDLTTLKHGTFFGGGYEDDITAVVVSFFPQGTIYIGGMTASPDLPQAPYSYDRIINSIPDGFLAAFTSDLGFLPGMTYLGGDRFDIVTDIALSPFGVYAVGATMSDDFPTTPGAFDETANGTQDATDIFVTKFSLTLRNVTHSTLLGGSLNDLGTGIDIDNIGRVYISGYTQSSDIPATPLGRAPTVDDSAALVARLSWNLAYLLYGATVAGDDDAGANDVAVDNRGNVFLTGYTDHDTDNPFPTTPGAFDTVNTNFDDEAFVVRIDVGVTRHVPYDFDGDRKADITVFWPEGGKWYIQQSYGGVLREENWGWSMVTPVAGDYDGDTRADVAVYYAGTWNALKSSDGEMIESHWGWSETLPVPADYDGDRKTDVAVYHPASGSWFIHQSGNDTLRQVQWGHSGAIPAPGDYDGDLIDDICVYERSSARWFVLQSSDGAMFTRQWGFENGRPVPGDYDGDDKTDLAVYDPATSLWYIRLSASQTLGGLEWGWSAAMPAQADYDGDGKDDISVFHPDSGGWYNRHSSDGELHLQNWGWSSSDPVIQNLKINEQFD